MLRSVRARSILFTVVICWAVLFSQLGVPGLMDDEAHYARLTQEMANAGDWLVPRLNGAAFIDKPVFFHWVQGVAYAVVPRGELAARLPSAVAALGLLAGLAWLATRLAGTGAGRSAWLMLITLPATLMLARTGYMDMLFSALLFGAVGFITVAMLTPSRSARAGAVICVALAVLTKGPIAAGLIGLWIGGLWLSGGSSRRAVAGLQVWRHALIVGLLISPWFVWMFSQYGDEFLRGYFGGGHVDYLTPRNSRSSSQWSFYLRMFLTAFFPWSLIAVGYGIDTLRRWWRGATIQQWEIWLWLWIALVLTVFTLVPFRVDRYIYPAAPACCLLAVRGWLAASAATTWQEFVATRVSVGIVAFVLVAAGVYLWLSLDDLNLPLSQAVALLPAVLVIGGLGFAWKMIAARHSLPRMEWPALTLVTVYAFAVFFAVPALRSGLPVEQVGRFVAERSLPDEPVALLGLDRWQMGLTYYLRTPPERLDNVTEAERFARTPGRRWIVAREEWLNRLATSGCVTFSVPAIVGTKGRGLRTQVWGDVVVVQFDAATALQNQACLRP